MPDTNELPSVTPVTSSATDVQKLTAQPKPGKTVNDWFRDLRMSADVNKTTLGVETDRVTPDLLMAASRKLLALNKREVEPDAKDSLEFQRIYGPADMFAEHVLRDAGRLGRQLLWKATNRGNIDFMPVGALDQHVSDVFNGSKLANMIDGSSPLETVEASYKLTRIGEGGVSSTDSAPTEMRLVQPSFLGFIDPVRSVEGMRVGLDTYMTKNCMRGTDGKLYQKFINARTGKEELVDSVTAAKSVVTTSDMIKSKTDYIYAVGGKTGVRIVKKADVDYYLPDMAEAFTNASNLVTGLSGVKELRLLMGCLHPLTSVLTVNKRNEISIIPAKDVASDVSIPGSTETGEAVMFPVQQTFAKFPLNRSWFRKVVLYSGRTLITSRDHRWSVLRGNDLRLVTADKLSPGDKILRTTYKNVPVRRTFINTQQLNKDIACLLGYAVRTLANPDDDKLTITYQPKHEEQVKRAVDKLGITVKYYSTAYKSCMALGKGWFYDWVKANIGIDADSRRIPSNILSADLPLVAAFLDAYSADENQMGIDSLEYIWVLNIPNTTVRDALSFLLARTETDTLYRDLYQGSNTHQIAIKLVEMKTEFGDFIVDEVKSVLPVQNAAIMVDIDINDNLYAVANGIVTHNSKYPQQAVSITGREVPLVQAAEGASGATIQQRIGAYLGARYTKKPGMVTAVRKDRVDMLYDDGTKGSIALYNNFPMNAKGYITNTPQVKAGMHLRKGDLVASSNYTDDKGWQATGTNLRTGWISWHGGTYEDAAVLSESAAKKLTSTTMYSNDLDLDKTITLGKRNYLSWKPGEYTKEQLSILDDEGIVKPGTVVRKGDPLVLAVRTTEPSPGTMGKRVLTDLTETWEHDHPGVVTDIVRTRSGVKVLATVTSPLEIGDKVSGMFGNKGVVSQILPDSEMPQDKNGKPLEMLMSPLGLVSRTNPAQLNEAVLGKIAKKTGIPEKLPAFYEGNMHDYVMMRAKQAHVDPDDDFYDPATGRKIPNVVNGYSYIHKLKHLSESKESGRGTGEYSSDDTPGGAGYDSAKRLGGLEVGAMVGHAAFENLLDAKLLRGQSNSEFWRSIRTGSIPTIPGEPLVQRKFFAHLQGAGVNVRKTQKGISVFALSNSDVAELAGPRELKTRDTYEAKNFRPIDGGLFGQDVFGINGDKWGYIQLDEPVPNPVMAEPMARLLRMSDRDFTAVASGKSTVDGMSSGADLKAKLASINLTEAAKQAQQEFKDAPASKKNAALKRYVAVERMRRAGLKASEYMLDKIPVLPPVFRPVSSHNGLTMVADANYLYAQLLDARDDIRTAKDAQLPPEYQQKARENLYRTWQELTGMYDPEDIKLRNKNVGGLLQWALGKGSPKFSAAQRKVIGTSVDTVGRGVIIPNSRLSIDQIGIPISMAFGIMAPFVERELVKRGYTPIDAMKMVKKQDKQALDVLQQVVQTHPVEMNRAPSLHKYNIMAFKPVLVQGHAIQTNPSVCPGFNADFDGDSVLNSTRIVIKVEEALNNFKNIAENNLTSLESMLLYGCNEQEHSASAEQPEGAIAMFNKSTKCAFSPVTCSLSDLPVVEGSEVQKSETVTEWQVKPGYYTDTVDPSTGERVRAAITHVSRHTGLKMYDCTIGTQGNYEHVITASEDHSLITLNPVTLELCKTRPQDAVGALVPRLNNCKHNDREFAVSRIKFDKEYNATYELGMFIGMMLGDGWINCQNLAFIACCNKGLQDYILDLVNNKLSIKSRRPATLQEYGPAEDRFSDKEHGRVAMYLDWDFCTAFHKAIGDGANFKRIPVDCLAAPRVHLIGILMGLLATDGSVNYSEGTTAKKSPSKTIILHTTSPVLRDNVQDLCRRIGIRTGATPYRGVNSTMDCYAVTISLFDIVRELHKNPTYFRIPMTEKQAAFEKITLGVENSDSTKTYDIVPFPEELRGEFVYAKLNVGDMLNHYNLGIKRGYIARSMVPVIVEALKQMDWDRYREPASVYKRLRHNHTSAQAKELIDRWCALVTDTDIMWETVTSVTESTCTEGWDCTVPGPYTFTLSTGTVVQDTVNIHVPVSDNARQEALNKMLPSRNLVGLADHKIMNKPEKEYTQGLYIATRMGQAPNGRAQIFRTLQEARDAYRQGLIDVDTPIQILQ